MFSAPTSTAPARRSAATMTASRAAGGRSALMRDPASVTIPATSNRFFTANGAPASGPGSMPAATAASIRSASRRAASAVTAVNELMAPSRLPIRSSAAAATSRARTRPARTAEAIASASSLTGETPGPARCPPAAGAP